MPLAHLDRVRFTPARGTKTGPWFPSMSREPRACSPPSQGSWRSQTGADEHEAHATRVSPQRECVGRRPTFTQCSPATPGWCRHLAPPPLFGPGKARHDDHSLAIYEAAGFTDGQADQAAATVFTTVLGNALGPAASGP